MLFGGWSIAQLLARALALLVAISVHEAAHAWMANRLGDSTARSLGRLSLNPLVHLDLLGTLMLLTAGFGWGKPVPVNPYNLRNGPKAGMALTSVVGPISNLLVAAVIALPLRLGTVPLQFSAGNAIIPTIADVLLAMVLLNIGLAIFNLLPVAPLDGFKVALGLLPLSLAVPLSRTEQFGPLILLGLLLSGRFLPIDPLGFIIGPVFGAFLQLFLGV
jgi:Zn-dependent protease